MQEIIICLTALLASGLTFFSGFGLGTILLPVFAVFFPLDLAIALTAIVHFLNNIFKFFLTGKHIDKAVLLRFGLPSIVAALLGAWLLGYLTDLQAFYSYKMYGTAFEIRPVKVVIALLLVFFALFDLIPKLKNLQISPQYLPVGGLISGFFWRTVRASGRAAVSIPHQVRHDEGSFHCHRNCDCLLCRCLQTNGLFRKYPAGKA